MKEIENAKRLINAIYRNIDNEASLEMLAKLLNYDKRQLSTDLLALNKITVTMKEL